MLDLLINFYRSYIQPLIKDDMLKFSIAFLLLYNTLLFYKESRQTLQHPRVFMRYTFFFALFVLIFSFVFIGWINFNNHSVVIPLFLLALSYAVIAFYSARKPFLFSKIKLDHLKKAINQGLALDREDLFSKKPLYFTDFTENYQYDLLHAKFFFDINKFTEAYEVYNRINEHKLFPNEKDELALEKANILINLGSIKEASDLLEKVKNSNESYYLMLKAFILENSGDIEGSSNHLQDAVNRIPKEKKESPLMANIYNNYGRIRAMENNYPDAVYFYNLSLKLAKQLHIKDLVNISYQNLILTYMRWGREEQVIQHYKEYEHLIDSKSTIGLLEFYNFKLVLARQSNDRDFLNQSIIVDYEMLKEKITGNKRLCLDIGQMRIVNNSGLMNDKLFNTICAKYDSYFSMDMPERYLALKEIYLVFETIGNYYIEKHKQVFSKIVNYMQTQALTELENYIASLKVYEIFQRYNMEKEKVCVIQRFIKPYNFKSVYDGLVGIKNGFLKNALDLEAIRIDFDIADECFSPENFDGFRFKYDQVLEKMNEHLKLVDESVSKIKFNPAFSEIYLRLAAYSFIMKDEKRARFFFSEFQNCKISINHYANWLQGYYQILCEHFG
jgi:tetratricopeptide (TPR) repeat protein